MNISLPEAVQVFLSSDTTLINLLPEQNGINQATTTTQKKAASVFLRRATQTAVKPFIIISNEYDFDNGNTSDGCLTRKLSSFRICVCGDTISRQLAPIEERIRLLLFGSELYSGFGVTQMYLPSANAQAENKVWVQCLLLRNRYFTDGQNVDGGESGLPTWVLDVQATYDER